MDHGDDLRQLLAQNLLRPDVTAELGMAAALELPQVVRPPS